MRALQIARNRHTSGGDMSYTIEKDWITKAGLRAVVVIVRASGCAWRCGYVEVPKDHPLYGVEHDRPTSKIPYEFVEKVKLGKKSPILVLTAGVGALEGEELRRSPDVLFDVHGGLTYSGPGSDGYPVESDGWWFGFDCAHFNDAYIECPPNYPQFPGAKVRSLEYVVEECERLAQQLVDFAHQLIRHEGEAKEYSD